MDAQRLGFRDCFFDVVVAQFVITAVPDPEATLDEFARVTRPGGEIILVNHLGAEAGLQRDLEHLFTESPDGSAGDRNLDGRGSPDGLSAVAACKSLKRA